MIRGNLSRVVSSPRLLVSVVVLALVVLAPAAARASTLDQKQEGTNATTSGVGRAQTFTAGLSGRLDRVEVFLFAAAPATGDLTVEIRSVDAAGAPSSTVLATTTVPMASVPAFPGGWVSVPISAPSVAGTQYAVVLREPPPFGGIIWRGGFPDPYAAGQAYVSNDGAAWSRMEGIDTAFRTYVVTDTTPPTVTCSATPASLKSNNHKLAAISTTVTVTDETGGSGSAGFKLVSVQSNQADSGLDPDDVPDDIQGWTTGTADTSGQLRIERFGGDRVYTLTYEGSDLAGNKATCQTTVTVGKGA